MTVNTQQRLQNINGMKRRDRMLEQKEKGTEEYGTGKCLNVASKSRKDRSMMMTSWLHWIALN
jgi:hypothetical protein